MWHEDCPGWFMNVDNFPERTDPHSQENVHNVYGTMPSTRTLNPILTGTSVLALKYRDGVMLAADTLASYGSLARYRNTNRIFNLSDNILVGVSGEISDMQQIKRTLDSVISVNSHPVQHQKYNAKNIHHYLSRLMYGHRTQLNPLLNSVVVCGCNEQGSFLGYVNYLGVTYESSTIATGMGAYLAYPILRKAVEGRENTLTQEEAIKIIMDCMKVLICGDTKAYNRVQLAFVSKNECFISQPQSVTPDWSVASCVIGY